MATTMLFTVILTFVGGTLAASDWRTAYLLIPGACIIGLVLTPVLLPKIPKMTGESFDLLGQVLLAIGIVGVLYGISQLAKSLTSPGTLVPIAVGVVMLASFAVWERRYARHFFPIEILRSPVFLAALCFGFIYNFGNSVSFLQLTNLWQYVNGLATSKVAIWQLPLLFAGIVSGLLTGRMMSKGVSNRAAGVTGGILTAIGLVLLAEHVPTESSSPARQKRNASLGYRFLPIAIFQFRTYLLEYLFQMMMLLPLMELHMLHSNI